jgi:hypothetical protein
MGVNVLVVFFSRAGETEKLALAAGVGAIQARANIRLRRLEDRSGSPSKPEDIEIQERMKKDYIAPREIDAKWAEALILAAPPDRADEMEHYLAAAGDLLKGKPCAVLGTFADAAAAAGLTVVPRGSAPENADGSTAYGRAAAEAAKPRTQAV